MKKLVLSGAALFALAAVALSGRLVRRYRVEGRSMLRAYEHRDRLLVERVSYRLRAPRIAEAVVVRQPGTNGRLDLKRVAASPGMAVEVRSSPYVLGEGEWFVLGDNLGESTDSRQLGPVTRRDIVGRVWKRY